MIFFVHIRFATSFEARNEHIRKQTLVNGFSAIHNFCIQKGEDKVLGNYAPIGSDKIDVICGDQTIEFNKSLLCSVSDVFQTMFENPDNVEHQSGSVNIEDVDPQTILSFRSLLESVTVQFEKLNLANVLKIVLNSHSSGWWFFPPKIWNAIVGVGLKKLKTQMK